MSIKTFIDRPITSVMISVTIVILGIISLIALPLEQFPDIAPPTVKVSATYTGANAETVMKSVVTPLEASINGVENMQYITSTASNNGTCVITIVFKQGSDPNMAVVNVQNRVASVQGLLPSEVIKSGINVRKTQNSNLKFITLYSPHGTYDSKFLTNYLKINVEPRLARIAGVGEVNVFGADYALRIWLYPDKMKAYGLVPADIDNVLAAQNLESPTGTLGAESDNTYQYTLKYRGRYNETTDYGNLLVKALPNGQILRLKDVAQIELGTADYNLKSSTKGLPGASASITQIAGSNANDIVKQIDAVEDDIRSTLPDDMVLEDQTSVMDFLNASISNVIDTLWIALVLVIIVVGAFLHSWRSMLIPTLAILVSLIGTFIFMYVVGFTLNLLTLFALVLVIGTVVDDSIIVVEAVEAKMNDGGLSLYKATVNTMKELKSALITTTIVFMSVFIPISFMNGTTGVFYREFGLTMAAAVGISLFNALTLCPTLCKLILKRKNNTKQKTTSTHTWKRIYEKNLTRLLHHPRWVFTSFPLTIVLLIMVIIHTKTGLVPQEDMGTIDVNVQCKPGYSLTQTGKVMDQVENTIKDLPQIKIYTRVDGRDAQQNQTSSAGFFSIRLKHWSKRTADGDDIGSVVNEIYQRTAPIKEAKINCGTLPMIRGYGSKSGFDLYIQNHSNEDFQALSDVTTQFVDKLNERPEISKANCTFNMNYPQYEVSVDAAKCLMHNVSPKEVLATLSSYVGGDYASNLNMYTKTYRVMVQASAQYRLDEQSLTQMYVRSNDGNLSSLSEYVTLKKVNGPEYLTHFNLFPSIHVTGSPANGYSSGQALQAVSEVAAKALPIGYGYELSGMSREESSLNNVTVIVLLLSIVFIYIILACLYESLLLPISVLLIIPIGLLGSFGFANLLGVENNIYMQTGLIMLIGMLAKTSILLTEVAVEQRRKHNLSIAQAAIYAARLRFRPILMTATVMIFGMLPLLFSTGAGAKGNLSISASVLGGMIVGTTALLYFVPILFCYFEKLDEKVRKKSR